MSNTYTVRVPGQDCGVHKGDTPAEAVLAHLRDIGYGPGTVNLVDGELVYAEGAENWLHVLGDLDRYTVREVEVSVAWVVSECIDGALDHIAVTGGALRVGDGELPGTDAAALIELYAEGVFDELNADDRAEVRERLTRWREEKVAELEAAKAAFEV
ncbi:hypothetical protein CR162_15305 [Pseudoroseomonas rhizosphaerae]|uniref:Uncharacterized protein n=1 Tax=Teichococcus rhizosphaerae TaxID=1335062 RepID=A0A2C7A244_9PROT|nr:hypothetical protein [Pseudoroseomonas rhizosphaerae]PHK94128.1 hypothetical protein CR162_15305 [Pseudoroseomonas rhizosphaerae]